ncbi:hypothetical protein IED13_01060 [Bosea sp. SSUT16]|uniref:Tail fiber domain-containing protein n=1 Tax=Bosea spartocytisi TaxID=2773451 RepID=A0A927E4J6_9HYPH|nr:hypothetical protein [Bosea spartocytisi]MBD3844268.1 hypothetical protein [Bosea spartocytisi]MCT4470626.1 hypothetical protein [Bosea spartocytisi]
MGLFSGTSARNAGIWAFNQAQDAANRGQGILDTAQGNALGALGQGFGQARTDLNTNYNGAIDRLNPWVTAGTGALGTYQGSLGLGGQAERDAAVSQFQNSPGYQYAVDQASDATARKASALGALGSGNTMAAIADRAQNMQNQEYGAWQDRLNGLSTQGMQAAGTQAGLQGQLGSSLANLGAQQGNAEAGIYTGMAGLGLNNLWNGTNTGIGAVTGAQKQARDNVNTGLNFGVNLAGSGLKLLGLGA